MKNTGNMHGNIGKALQQIEGNIMANSDIKNAANLHCVCNELTFSKQLLTVNNELPSATNISHCMWAFLLARIYPIVTTS